MTDEELVTVLREALVERERARDLAQFDVDSVQAAIDALSGTPPESGGGTAVAEATTVEREPLPPSATPKPVTGGGRSPEGKTLKDVAKERATCPECGKECSRIGIGTHRRTAHGVTKTAVPRSPLAAVPAPPGSDSSPSSEAGQSTIDGHGATTGQQFECDDCDATYPTTRELTAHTIDVHGRRTNATERIARPVAS